MRRVLRWLPVVASPLVGLGLAQRLPPRAAPPQPASRPAPPSALALARDATRELIACMNACDREAGAPLIHPQAPQGPALLNSFDPNPQETYANEVKVWRWGLEESGRVVLCVDQETRYTRTGEAQPYRTLQGQRLYVLAPHEGRWCLWVTRAIPRLQE